MTDMSTVTALISAELIALRDQWHANAAIREAQPPNKRDASAAVVYRICASEIDGLLRRGPLVEEGDTGTTEHHEPPAR